MAEGYVKSPAGIAHIGFLASATIKDGIERVATIKKSAMIPLVYEASSDAHTVSLSVYQSHPSFPINGFF